MENVATSRPLRSDYLFLRGVVFLANAGRYCFAIHAVSSSQDGLNRDMNPEC